MDRNLKFYYYVLLTCLSSYLYSNEITNYSNIKIKADVVTFDEVANELLLKENLIISFGNFNIFGDTALISYKNKKLIVDGSPALINSKEDEISGAAKRFIIHPNLSLEMLGDANLLEHNNSIYAEQITYQIK
tara:strand:+ start:694 stop:1092 length:399 start_codon:yes stop_codon:yes gene_type:complete